MSYDPENPEHAAQDFCDLVNAMGIDWVLSMTATACTAEARGFSASEAEADAWRTLGADAEQLAKRASSIYGTRRPLVYYASTGAIVDTSIADERNRVVAIRKREQWVDPHGGIFTSEEIAIFDFIRASARGETP